MQFPLLHPQTLKQLWAWSWRLGLTEGSSRTGRVAQGQPLPLSEPPLLFCGHRSMGGSEEAAPLVKVSSCGHRGEIEWGCRMTGRGLVGGRGHRDGRNYSGPRSPHTHAPQGSDGKRSSCLPGKDVSCAARTNPPSATASPSQKPPLLGHLGTEAYTPHLAPSAPLNHPVPPTSVSYCPGKSQNTQMAQAWDSQ